MSEQEIERISVQKAQEILIRNGIQLSVQEAEKALDLIYSLVEIILENGLQKGN